MHDGIHIEKAGVPAAVICTDKFQATAMAMAEVWGAARFPMVFTEHPIGTLDRSAIKARAVELLAPVVAVLTGIQSTTL